VDGGELVEDRCDEHGRHGRAHDHEADRHQRAPEPPGARRPTEHAVEQHQQQRADHDPDAQSLQPVEQPVAEALRQQPIGLLAVIGAVEPEREADDRRDEEELDPVGGVLQRPETDEPPRALAHPRRDPPAEQGDADGRPDRGVHEVQDVVAARVGLRARPAFGGHGVQVGPGGGLGVRDARRGLGLRRVERQRGRTGRRGQQGERRRSEEARTRRSASRRAGPRGAGRSPWGSTGGPR
jgi:hypothetical protein